MINSEEKLGVFIIPTGVGASIGGFAGDASCYAREFSKEAKLIVNPNVVNAGVFSGINDNMLYTEGFILDENGPFHCSMNAVEVMGRDVSVVAGNKNAVTPTIRAIIPSDSGIDHESKSVSFSLKPYKTFIFRKETEERIYLEK